MSESWIDRHSVGCFKCGILFDERNGIPGIGGEGTICPDCHRGEDIESAPGQNEAGPLLDVIMAGDYGKQWVSGVGIKWGFNNESEILDAVRKYKMRRETS